MQSRYEMEDFVEPHICKLCLILRSRVLRGVCPQQGYCKGWRLPLELQCKLYNLFRGHQGDVSQYGCGSYNTRFR